MMMKTLTQATLTAGNRQLVVQDGMVAVFPTHNGTRSNAAWMVADDDENTRYHYDQRPWITTADTFPAEVVALISGVLNAECPMQPLMDWVIEFGPKNLAAELEALQENLIAKVG